MVPKATVKVFEDMLEKYSRGYLDTFNVPEEKEKYDAMAALLRDEPEIYFHSFFLREGEVLPGLYRQFKSIRPLWKGKEVDLYVVMGETCWQEQYVAQAREDLAWKSGEEKIPPKTIRSFEEVLQYLLRDYPLAERTLDLLRTEPEVCVHALFLAMRQKQKEVDVKWQKLGYPQVYNHDHFVIMCKKQKEDGIKWHQFGYAAHPLRTEQARQDLQDAVSA